MLKQWKLKSFCNFIHLSESIDCENLLIGNKIYKVKDQINTKHGKIIKFILKIAKHSCIGGVLFKLYYYKHPQDQTIIALSKIKHEVYIGHLSIRHLLPHHLY